MAIITNDNKALKNVSGRNVNLLKTLPIDVTISEGHQWSQEITDKPVEGGSKVSDNIILNPVVVNMSGILLTDDSFTMQEKIDMLEELRKLREPFTVTTSLKTYEQMFFDSSIEITRDSSTSGGVFFSCTLKHINFIESQTTEVPAENVAKTEAPNGEQLSESKGQPKPDKAGKRSREPKKDTGKKTAQPRKPKPAEKDQSWLIKMTSG